MPIEECGSWGLLEGNKGFSLPIFGSNGKHWKWNCSACKAHDAEEKQQVELTTAPIK